MDISRMYQPQQEYNCGNGIAKVNVFNGRLLYEYPILSIGSGSYSLNTSLIYNSYFKENDFGNKILGFGNGWKYNFEQFLFPYKTTYNIEGFSHNDYVYIDSNWCIHRFVKYETNSLYSENESAYYDESGTGLKLVIKNNTTPKIYDELGNIYVFNNERLVTIISGLNSVIQKHIQYNTQYINRVDYVYDSRKVNRKIMFEYDLTGMPIKIYSTNHSIIYLFQYEQKKLIKIIKKINNLEIEKHKFTYDMNNKISYVIDCQSLDVLKINYSLKNDLSQVMEIILSTIKKDYKNKRISASTYLSDNSYIGELDYLTNNDIIIEGSNFEFNNKWVKENMTYIYQTSYTEVVNKNNIIFRYYFDLFGKILSVFEYSLQENNHKFLTTYRDIGDSIDISGDTNIYINNSQAKEIYKKDNKYVLSIKDTALETFKNSVKLMSKDHVENFNLSFWLKFNQSNDSSLIAKLNFKLDGESRTSKMLISETLGNVWQLVNLNLNLEEPNKALTDLSITFEVDESKKIENDKIFVSNVNIYKANTQTICIDNSKISNLSYKELKIGTKLYYLENDFEVEQTISGDFYLTENDIIATYRSLFYSIQNNKAKYDLFYCNKSRVKSVYYVSLEPSKLADGQINNNFKYFKFGFHEYDDNDNVQNNGIPNYHFRKLDLVNLTENEKTYIISEIQRRIHSRGNNRFYFETKTAYAPVYEVNINKRISDDNSIVYYLWENDDGTKRASKYYKNIFKEGETTPSQVFKIITSYTYDEFGNLTKTEMYDENNMGDIITKTNIYDLDKENIIQTIEDECNVYYDYYDDGKIKYIKDDESKIFFKYDFSEELEELCFYDGNDNLVNSKKIIKKANGNINCLKDLYNVSHGFLYNTFNELSMVSRNKKILEQHYKKLDGDNECYYTKIYQNKDWLYRYIGKYDKYGKVLSYEVEKLINNTISEKLVTRFEYENSGKTSHLLERIKRIIDPFSNSELIFTYDDKDGTTCTIQDNSNNFKIIYNSNGSVEYDIAGDLYKMISNIQQEDQININPKCCNNYINDRNNENNIAINCFSFDYEYDNLGRLKIKKSKKYDYDKAYIQINNKFDYKINTEIPEKIYYEVKSFIKENSTEKNAELIYENEYEKNNIIKVIEKGTRFISNPADEENLTIVSFDNKTYEYKYDDFNRLIKEITPSGDVFEYIYGETSNMIECVKKNGLIIERIEYETDKLTNILKDDIMTNVLYDNYGNIIKIGDVNIGYNALNLMDSYDLNSNQKINFSYNYQGIRLKKEKYGEYTLNYYLDGNKIIGEDLLNNNNEVERKFRFYYDATGIIGIDYITNDNVSHYYNLIKDSLGNVSKIMNEGKYIGEYVYDAWGNCQVVKFSSISSLDEYVIENNPFRYKGYYFDKETNLYYCETRYYSSDLRIFLSPDSIDYLNLESLNGLNLYCYCNNDPVNNFDPCGQAILSITIGGIALGYYLLALLGIVATGAAIYVESETHIIQNTLVSIDNAISDLKDDINNAIFFASIELYFGLSQLFSAENNATNIHDSTNNITSILTLENLIYQSSNQNVKGEHNTNKRKSNWDTHSRANSRRMKEQNRQPRKPRRKIPRKDKYAKAILLYLLYKYTQKN